jgi:DNA polymerase-3 subunit chi
MMKHPVKTVTFYLIRPDSEQSQPAGFRQYILFLARYFVEQGAKIYLNCENKSDAESLAEQFWQVPPESFLAHNLVGEGPKHGTGIEIGYQKVSPAKNRQLIINLANSETTFANYFTEVIDFVPCEEKAKQLARERYKIYRQAGYKLQTIEIEHPPTALSR